MVLFLPVSVHAAWWNPGDWFKEKNDIVPVVTSTATKSESKAESEFKLATSTPVQDKCVDNSSLYINQIKILNETITALKLQINTLTTTKDSSNIIQNSTYKIVESDIPKQSKEDKEEQEKQEKIESIDSDMKTLMSEIRAIRSSNINVTAAEIVAMQRYVNRLLGAYRVVDPNMPYKDLYLDADIASLVKVVEEMEDYMKYR